MNCSCSAQNRRKSGDATLASCSNKKPGDGDAVCLVKLVLTVHTSLPPNQGRGVIQRATDADDNEVNDDDDDERPDCKQLGLL